MNTKVSQRAKGASLQAMMSSVVAGGTPWSEVHVPEMMRPTYAVMTRSGSGDWKVSSALPKALCEGAVRRMIAMEGWVRHTHGRETEQELAQVGGQYVIWGKVPTDGKNKFLRVVHAKFVPHSEYIKIMKDQADLFREGAGADDERLEG